MGNRYVNEFLSLKCGPLVLESVGILGHKPDKEISEAMGVIRKLREIVLHQPDKYQLVDLCSGNALVPVIAAHLLPITKSYAIDKLVRRRRWNITRNFEYHITDIFDERMHKFFKKPTILTAVHACSKTAVKTIEIFNENPNIEYLILIPCCEGDLNDPISQFIKKESYAGLAWSNKLFMKCQGETKISKDNFIMSPKNHIIVSSKKKET